MNGRSALAAVSLFAFPALAANEQPRIPIYLEVTADEPLSKQFAYFVREGLRASQGMSLSDDSEDTLHQLRIVAMDNGRMGIAYSVVWTYSGGKQLASFLNHSVGLCGYEVLRSCADSLLAAADERLAAESKTWSKFLKELDQSKKIKGEPPP